MSRLFGAASLSVQHRPLPDVAREDAAPCRPCPCGEQAKTVGHSIACTCELHRRLPVDQGLQR
jgi:hypothetical protein